LQGRKVFTGIAREERVFEELQALQGRKVGIASNCKGSKSFLLSGG
jgi:hypothetical protein